MSDRISAKTVAITGAGSGIGLAAAIHYAHQGWQVGLIGRGEVALADALQRVTKAGGIGHVVVADVSDNAALERAAVEVEAALGPIEVWINNAAIGFYGAFVDLPEAAFRRVVDVNLHGTVNGTRVALSRMRPRNRGTIVQVLSAISYRGVPLQSAYSATKFGLRGFTEAVRAELINERSRVNVTMVHPPSVNTPFYSHAGSVMDKTPRPPPLVYQPEMIGEALYLAGTVRRREWHVGGEAVAITLANKVAPGLMDLLMGFAAIWLQQTSRKDVAALRDPNAYTPSTRAAGIHGPFDGESVGSSAQWWLSKRPHLVQIGLGAIAIGMFGVARFGLRRSGRA